MDEGFAFDIQRVEDQGPDALILIHERLGNRGV